MINILVTAVGSELAFSIIKAIRTMQTPYRLIGCDINKKVLGKCWCDTFYVVPKARNEDAYIRVIRKIIKEEKVDFLNYMLDKSKDNEHLIHYFENYKQQLQKNNLNSYLKSVNKQ